MSYQIIFTDSLSHHGIKGQRWGIRRFRKKDGSLTSAGKRRYQDDKPKKKSYHRVTLERRYMDSGMSKEDAEREADKKIKMEKGIAIAAGATALTVASVIAYKKIGQEYADRVVKKGETLHTLSKDADRVADTSGKFQEHFYAANKKDRGKYRSLFGDMITRENTKNGKIKLDRVGKFDIQTTMLEDVKVASPNKARKVFIDEFKKDPRYAKYLKENIGGAEGFRRNPDISKAKKVILKMAKGQKVSDKEIGRLYNAYNVLLVDNSGKDIHKSFLSALKSKGYGGVIDLNDLKYSGFNAKQPMIIFDKSKLNMTPPKNVSRLDLKDIKKAQNTELGKAYLKLVAESFAVGGVVGGVSNYKNYDDKVIEKYKNKEATK